MQFRTGGSAIALGSSIQNINAAYKSSRSSELQSFCQLKIEHLIADQPIFWARIVYYDPLLSAHQVVSSYAQDQPHFSEETLAYLNSQEWLIDFPPAFTLNEVSLTPFASSCYICPFGYKKQKPEYILVFAHEPLALTWQQNMKQSAMLLSKYLDIYSECECQQAEIRLLEHVVQRVGHQLRNPLALINLYAENLYLGLPSGSWQEQAAIIRETVQNLDTNLTELIYCGQGTKLRVAHQELRALVAESIQGLKPLIDQKQLQIRYPDTSTILAIDRWQMKQVFDNLLSNAVHF